ncbi:hypothetical protein I310_05855 [Cryptococcus deuterogattii CA1014]|nr:hypothetical protein I310_05855 [Cryptococcus deuterogattii CA1014]
MQTKHQAFFSRNQSGLNANRLSLFKDPPLGTFQRGAVSMPSSPLLGVQSMGSFGNMGAILDTNAVVDTNTSSQDSQSWLPFSNSTSPQLDAFHSQPPQGPSLFFDSVTNSISHLHPKNMTLPSASSLGLGGYSSDEYNGLKKETVDNGKQRKKKRAQVRVACTRCQKACKKCSDSRPCERCDKYGLSDCVDTTRKPRKTGIKRGPYKRRASKSARNTGSDIYLPPTHSQPQSQFKFDSLQPFQHICSQISNMHCPACTEESGVPSYPPGPRLKSISTEATSTSLLTQALSAALTGPRWVDGRRVSLSDPSLGNLEDIGRNGEPKFSPMYPRTPVGGFPMTLGTAGDPFSRAVSPIRSFGIGNNKDESGGHERGIGENGRKYGATIEIDSPQVPSRDRSSLFITITNPFLPNTNTSRNVSRTRNNEGYSPNPICTPSTLHSPALSSQPQLQPHLDTCAPPGTASPMYIPSKTRKPTLWTLVAADSWNGGLTPSSPPLDLSQSQPQPQPQFSGMGEGLTNRNGNDSPTLFNQPMEMDQDFESWGGWGSATNKEDKYGSGFKSPRQTSSGDLRVRGNSMSYNDARQERTLPGGEMHSHALEGRRADGVEANSWRAKESVEDVGSNSGMSFAYVESLEGLMGV